MLLETIRTWQLVHMENAIKSFENLVNTDPDNIKTYRDSGDGWTVLEVMCHLRDFDGVFMQRAKLTVEEDNPDLPFPSPDQLAIDNKYNEQSVETVLEEWKQARYEMIGFLKNRADTDWERVAKHPTRGAFTLHDQLFLVAFHDMLHLEQATRILAEKLGG